jgi:hypothetical protein
LPALKLDALTGFVPLHAVQLFQKIKMPKRPAELAALSSSASFQQVFRTKKTSDLVGAEGARNPQLRYHF